MYFGPNTQNITVENIRFDSTLDNAVRFNGENGNPISPVAVRNCYFNKTMGRYGNSAGLRIRYCDNFEMYNCTIVQGNRNAEVDGMYIDYSNNISLVGNTIILENNTDTSQHLDCMQITDTCSNITIERNYIENASLQPLDRNRQCIYITETSGDIKIRNNVIVSQVATGINMSFYPENDSIQIFNNTLIGKSNPGKHIRLFNSRSAGAGKLNIKNNIFSKEGSQPQIYAQAIYFDTLNEDTFSNNILNNNLYWNNNPGITPTIQFQDVNRVWNYTLNNYYEESGVGANPQFISSADYNLEYSSPAKNRGVGLLNQGVTIDKAYSNRPYWNYDFDIGAYEVEDKQLKIGIMGVGGNDEVTHTVEISDTYWERNSSGNWIISTDQELTSASFTTLGNSDTSNTNSFNGFQYKWLDVPDFIGSIQIGTGLYKLTNNYNNNSDYIYIDLRDAVNGYSLNSNILYVSEIGYYCKQNGVWTRIPNGEVVGIWELPGGSVTTHTNLLDQFWSHCLVDLEKNNHPFLAWGPYTQSGTNNYILFRKNGSSFDTLTSGNTWRHYDTQMNIVQPGTPSGHTVKYYVSVQSNNTDTVDYEIVGKDPEKIAGNIPQKFSYSISQNYPNPFNPSTNISFSTAEKGLVTIILYDVLGREIRELLNSELEPGMHQYTFNLGTLASGIYYYQIAAGNFNQTKKLQLLK